jgi:hypothetical protein
MAAKSFRNVVLKHLDPETIARLRLRRVELPLLHDLETPGAAIQHIYFLEQGIDSMTTCFENGSQVETSVFGYESAIGISALMGTEKQLEPDLHAARRIWLRGSVKSGRGRILAQREISEAGSPLRASATHPFHSERRLQCDAYL